MSHLFRNSLNRFVVLCLCLIALAGSAQAQTTIANVRDFGAVCDGATNDQPAFVAALASLAATGGTLYVPAGVCLVEKPIGQKYGAVNVTGLHQITVYGDGAKQSILKINPAANLGDTHILAVIRSNNIIIRDIGFNGSSFTAPATNQQMSGLYVLNSKGILIERVDIQQAISSGSYLIGTDDAECPVKPCFTENVTIQDSTFFQNRRAGSANQGGIKNISYLRNTYDQTFSGQDIDFEPTGTRPGAENVIITGNKLLTTGSSFALTIIGNSPARAKNWTVTGNTFARGVQVGKIDGLVFSDNTISATTGRAMDVYLDAHNVTVSNNRISRLSGGEVIHATGKDNANLTFDGNLIYLNAPGNIAFYSEGTGSDITFRNNQIVGAAGGSSLSATINIRNVYRDGIPRRNFQITGNRFWNVPVHVKVSTIDVLTRFENVEIADNVTHGTSAFVVWYEPLPASSFITNLTVINNTVSPLIATPDFNTPTPTARPTGTPSPTASPTLTSSLTVTASPTATLTQTGTPTATASATPSRTSTATSTPTATPTPLCRWQIVEESDRRIVMECY